jgi:hypothetical protein
MLTGLTTDGTQMVTDKVERPLCTLINICVDRCFIGGNIHNWIIMSSELATDGTQMVTDEDRNIDL